MRALVLLVTHGLALAAGFAAGIYLLPILTAPPSPDMAELQARAEGATRTATLTRDLRGSDFLHWGEGTVAVTDSSVVHMGRLAPGPDYKLYLTRALVTHEDEFLPVKDDALLVGDVKSFDGFALDLPAGTDLSDWGALIVWCEAFGEFITAAAWQ